MELREKFLNIEKELNEIAVERYDENHGLIIAALSKLNILFLGPPGVGKSMLVNRLTAHLKNGRVYSRLLTSFSTPEELYGPYSMQKIEESKYERVTTKTLIDADLSFIDEVFKASSGILNSMLQVMNERTFLNGTHLIKLPLISLIGASNELPNKEDNLEAMFDRFHLKYHTKPIQEPGNFLKMLQLPEVLPEPKTRFTVKDLDEASKEISATIVPSHIHQKLAKLKFEFNKAGISVTDRTHRSAIKVIKTEAWLQGHKEVEDDDLDILRHMFWDDPAKKRVIYLKILELTNPEKNVILDKYEESMRLVREVFEEKDDVKAHELALEYSTKLKMAKNEIIKLKNNMIAKNKNVEDIDIMLKEIDKQIKSIFTDIIGIEF